METRLPERKLLEDIELRQDELLKQLDQLNDRIEAVLREWVPARPADPVVDIKKVA